VTLWQTTNQPVAIAFGYVVMPESGRLIHPADSEKRGRWRG
jgi:hypothetical protein